MESTLPNFYLLIYNISKVKNIGTLIRSANAFGVKQIFILGSNKKILKKFFGSQGTVSKSEFLFFENTEELKEFCKSKSIHFCGVEIGGTSKPIHKYEFKGDTLFMVGNEGQGMNNKQKELCGDELVYIPQYSNKTASLNVACAGSIIFHHFALWAGFKETEVTDEKYNVDQNIRSKIEFTNKDFKKNTETKSSVDDNINFDNFDLDDNIEENK